MSDKHPLLSGLTEENIIPTDDTLNVDYKILKTDTVELSTGYRNYGWSSDTRSMNNLSVSPITTTVGAVGQNYSNNVWVTTSGSNGTSAIDWSKLSINSNPTILSQSGTIELRGENADININGRSLMDAIGELEQRLNILVPNPDLEAEWDELRELGERYRELEKKCKEKGEMWKKLKSMPPTTD